MAGFPQYRFKASMSNGAFRNSDSIRRSLFFPRKRPKPERMSCAESSVFMREMPSSTSLLSSGMA